MLYYVSINMYVHTYVCKYTSTAVLNKNAVTDLTKTVQMHVGTVPMYVRTNYVLGPGYVRTYVTQVMFPQYTAAAEL